MMVLLANDAIQSDFCLVCSSSQHVFNDSSVEEKRNRIYYQTTTFVLSSCKTAHFQALDFSANRQFMTALKHQPSNYTTSTQMSPHLSLEARMLSIELCSVFLISTKTEELCYLARFFTPKLFSNDQSSLLHFGT